MHTSQFDKVLPLRRFEAIYAALCRGEDHWDDAAWCRFAAQAAIFCPEEPAEIAAAISRNAVGLKQITSWSDALRSPLRFVVAAVLVHDGSDPRTFLDDIVRVRHLFREAHINRRGIYEVLAILTLRALGGPIDHARVQTMHAIHDRMKAYHWWITGPDDLPACALLSGCPGTPEAIAAGAERIYLALADNGCLRGNHLQTAANLLAASGLEASLAVERFERLVDRFKARPAEIWYEHYDGVALLSRLDHDPDLVVGHFLGVLDELSRLDPPVHGEANYNVAADITFLDLVRLDRQREQLTAAHDVENMLRHIHLHRAASMVLIGSTIEPTLLDLDWLLPGHGI